MKEEMTWFDIIDWAVGSRMQENGRITDVLIGNGKRVQIRYCSFKHSTGHDINIFLISDKKELHVYRDSKWVSAPYSFNDLGKPKGWLERGPWQAIIENQINEWADQITKKKLLAQEEARAQREKQKNDHEKLVEHFQELCE